MPDYEAMILARQEAIEIWEDEPESEFLSDEDVSMIERIYYERHENN